MSSPRSAKLVFRAIADPTRRNILDRLRTAPMRAGDIADAFPVSRPAISKHLRILRAARLVRQSRKGRERFYSISPQPLEHIDVWLAAYRLHWSANLVALKEFVESEQHQRAGDKS
ncbi:MAG: winged helix-turn-helix transcriptional regulator [Phycisphaeraceae bacterium]|nr:winged helix-turn-helix transcriptional regulator [Phycisphaeraceae bacterium]